MYQEVELVDQSYREQLADHGGRAAHRDMGAARPVLESGDALYQVSLQLLRVAPRELEIPAGDDDLPRVAQVLGELGVRALAFGFDLWPRSRKTVVGDAAEEDSCVKRAAALPAPSRRRTNFSTSASARS